MLADVGAGATPGGTLLNDVLDAELSGARSQRSRT